MHIFLSRTVALLSLVSLTACGTLQPSNNDVNWNFGYKGGEYYAPPQTDI